MKSLKKLIILATIFAICFATLIGCSTQEKLSKKEFIEIGGENFA